MEQCVQLGLTKSIGISNFNIKQVNDILEIAIIKPVVNQVMIFLDLINYEYIHFTDHNNCTR